MLQEEEGLAWGAGLGVASAGVTFAVVVSMEFPASSGEEGFCVKYELEVGQVDGIVVGVAVTVGGAGVPGTGAVVPVSKPANV